MLFIYKSIFLLIYYLKLNCWMYLILPYSCNKTSNMLDTSISNIIYILLLEKKQIMIVRHFYQDY